jgi:hypothetical protein
MGSTLGIWLVLSVLVALVAYREAVNFAKQNGRTPWDMPPWMWAVTAGVLGLLLGGILLVIARRTTKPATAVPAGWAPVPAQPTSATWSDAMPAVPAPVAAAAPPMMREVPAVWLPQAAPAQTWRPAD